MPSPLSTARPASTGGPALTGRPAATNATASAARPEPAAAGPSRVELSLPGGWFPVCDRADLLPGRGVAALLPDGRQVAVFADRAGAVRAVDNRDPFTGAYVLSRGLLGSLEGRPFVASPLLKQRFCLTTGACLDDPSVTVRVYRVRTG